MPTPTNPTPTSAGTSNTTPPATAAAVREMQKLYLRVLAVARDEIEAATQKYAYWRCMELAEEENSDVQEICQERAMQQMDHMARLDRMRLEMIQTFGEMLFPTPESARVLRGENERPGATHERRRRRPAGKGGVGFHEEALASIDLLR
jgi:hypothetical protein